MQFLDNFEHNIRNFTRSVAAVAFNSSNVDIGKIVVSSAFTGGDSYFRRCRMVVYL